MSDHRPQYGEYATPEEQRRLAGLPPEGADAPAVHPTATLDATAAPAAEPEARPRAGDRIVTIALLAYGLVNVVMTAIAYLDLPMVLSRSMDILGIDGDFSNFVQGRLWGGIAAVILVVGYGITAWISLRRLRAGKRSWWVPLVGALATMLVVSICIMIPMMGDPAFTAHLQSGGQ